MDIGRVVRRFRAEPVTSPVPGEAPAVEEPVLERADGEQTADERPAEQPTAEGAPARSPM